MKFLCVECDGPMALEETRGPDRGSMTVVFGCPGCGRRVAMLTNAAETQMVASLGVKIGPGATAAARPMQGLRSSLAGHVAADGDGAPAGHDTARGDLEAKSEARCPFTGAVREAMASADGPAWTEAARARMERVPSFVRPMVERGIEDVARRDGIALIDEEVLAKVRTELGM